MDVKPTWLSTLNWEVNEKLCKTKNKNSPRSLPQPLFCEVLFSGSDTCTGENCKKGIFEGLNPAICCSWYCWAGIFLSSAKFGVLKQTWNMTDNPETFSSCQALEMTQSKLFQSIWLWKSDRWDKLLLHKLWYSKQTALDENIYFGFTCEKQMLYFHYVRSQGNTQPVFRARKNHTGWEIILKCKQSIL